MWLFRIFRNSIKQLVLYILEDIVNTRTNNGLGGGGTFVTVYDNRIVGVELTRNEVDILENLLN